LQAHLVELDNGEYISITENCIYCKNQIVDYMRELTDGELENIEARCELVKQYID